jgi:hypothetical protein
MLIIAYTEKENNSQFLKILHAGILKTPGIGGAEARCEFNGSVYAKNRGSLSFYVFIL